MLPERLLGLVSCVPAGGVQNLVFRGPGSVPGSALRIRSQDALPGLSTRIRSQVSCVFFSLSLSLSLSLSISFFLCLSSDSKGVNVFTAKLSTGAMVLVDVLQVAIQYHELAIHQAIQLATQEASQSHRLHFSFVFQHSVRYSIGD